MAHTISIYNYQGIKLTEIDASFTAVEILNQAGQGTLSIPKKDKKFLQYQEQLVRFRNIILIEDDRIGKWAAVMEEPQDWSGTDIKIPLNDYMYALSYRVLAKTVRVTYTGNSGDIITQWLAEANSAQDILIDVDPSNIYPLPPTLSYTLASETVYNALQKYPVPDTGFDWWLEPYFTSSNNLRFNFKWQVIRGDYQPVKLVEGTSVAEGNMIYRQSGPVANRVLAFGNNADYNLTQKYVAEDQGSQDTYGLTEYPYAVQSDSFAVVTQAARKIRNKFGKPRNIYYPIALEQPGKNLFPFLRIGDFVQMELIGYGLTAGQIGINGMVRIVGRSWSNHTGGTRRLQLTVNTQ